MEAGKGPITLLYCSDNIIFPLLQATVRNSSLFLHGMENPAHSLCQANLGLPLGHVPAQLVIGGIGMLPENLIAQREPFRVYLHELG